MAAAISAIGEKGEKPVIRRLRDYAQEEMRVKREAVRARRQR